MRCETIEGRFRAEIQGPYIGRKMGVTVRIHMSRKTVAQVDEQV